MRNAFTTLMVVLALGVLSALVYAAAASVTVPASNGAVTFPHDAHSKMAGVSCKTCHHTSTGESVDKKCRDCHGSAAEGAKLAAKDAFHKTCKDCHAKSGKGPTKCNECHKK